MTRNRWSSPTPGGPDEIQVLAALAPSRRDQVEVVVHVILMEMREQHRGDVAVPVGSVAAPLDETQRGAVARVENVVLAFVLDRGAGTGPPRVQFGRPAAQRDHAEGALVRIGGKGRPGDSGQPDRTCLEIRDTRHARRHLSTSVRSAHRAYRYLIHKYQHMSRHTFANCHGLVKQAAAAAVTNA